MLEEGEEEKKSVHMFYRKMMTVILHMIKLDFKEKKKFALRLYSM